MICGIGASMARFQDLPEGGGVPKLDGVPKSFQSYTRAVGVPKLDMEIGGKRQNSEWRC